MKETGMSINACTRFYIYLCVKKKKELWQVTMEAVQEAVGGDEPSNQVKNYVELSRTNQEQRRGEPYAKHDTESGMTKAQAKVVNKFEDRHAYDTTETAAIIDAKGRVVERAVKGTYSHIELNHEQGKDYSNAIMTHNHPSGANKTTLSDRIGSSLSGTDLGTAVGLNVRGMRARSGNYLYSMERGKNGWGGSSTQIKNAFDKAYEKALQRYTEGKVRSSKTKIDGSNDLINYAFGKYGRNAKAVNFLSRVLSVSIHQANKAVAKRYGLKYTRRKVK